MRDGSILGDRQLQLCVNFGDAGVYCNKNGCVKASRLLGSLKSDGVRSLSIESSTSIEVKVDGDVHIMVRSSEGDKRCDSKTRLASC